MDCLKRPEALIGTSGAFNGERMVNFGIVQSAIGTESFKMKSILSTRSDDFVKIVDRTRCQLENKCNVKPRIFMTILRLSKFYSPQLLGVFQ